MKVLIHAAKAAQKAKLVQPSHSQRYSSYPVHDGEFWGALFKFAKSAKTAQKVLDEISQIEEEPCIENDRVWNNVRAAKSMARLTLLN